MNRVTLKQVESIAAEVRSWAQEKATRANMNARALRGWCAISSAKLQRELMNAGIESAIHYNNGHCFVVVEDHVVDVTATQFHAFERQPVLILHLKEAEEHHFYQTLKTFKYPSELRDYQIRQNWPKKQIAYVR